MTREGAMPSPDTEKLLEDAVKRIAALQKEVEVLYRCVGVLMEHREP